MGLALRPAELVVHYRAKRANPQSSPAENTIGYAGDPVRERCMLPDVLPLNSMTLRAALTAGASAVTRQLVQLMPVVGDGLAVALHKLLGVDVTTDWELQIHCTIEDDASPRAMREIVRSLSRALREQGVGFEMIGSRRSGDFQVLMRVPGVTEREAEGRAARMLAEALRVASAGAGSESAVVADAPVLAAV